MRQQSDNNQYYSNEYYTSNSKRDISDRQPSLLPNEIRVKTFGNPKMYRDVVLSKLQSGF
jgi:hypothetical protein